MFIIKNIYLFSLSLFKWTMSLLQLIVRTVEYKLILKNKKFDFNKGHISIKNIFTFL